jgi:uncharacterized repeat protein (TIGR03803 family)
MRNTEGLEAIYCVRVPATLIRGIGKTLGLIGLILAASTVSRAQNQQAITFQTLVNFNGVNGANPGLGPLIRASDGTLYGTSLFGGAYGGGNVFKITPSGSLVVIYSFCAQPSCTDGSIPGWLVLGSDGNLYGSAGTGGAYNNGTVFRLTPTGALTTLYSFCAMPNCSDGSGPGGLVQGTDGNLYGVATSGGNSSNQGVIFKVSPTGAMTTLYTFCSQPNCPDGAGLFSALIQASDGTFYGTTQFGGSYGGGEVFRITPGGALTLIYSFCAQPNCTDGSEPIGASLIQGPNGNLYGTAASGGANPGPYGFGGGAVFEVSLAGAYKTLYNFCAQSNCTDGNQPATLLQVGDGNFYGTTNAGGVNSNCSFSGPPGCGTVFKLTPGGELTKLHDFVGTDGELYLGGLVRGEGLTFYGPAWVGGSNGPGCIAGCGTVFSISIGRPLGRE